MPPKDGAANNRLVAIGSSPSREYSLDKPTIDIGSHPSNDVVLDDTTVSRRHAKLVVTDEGVMLEDFGSKNGTLRGGDRVTRPIQLADGDAIHVGSLLVTFHLRAPLEPTETQTP